MLITFYFDKINLIFNQYDAIYLINYNDMIEVLGFLGIGRTKWKIQARAGPPSGLQSFQLSPIPKKSCRLTIIIIKPAFVNILVHSFSQNIITNIIGSYFALEATRETSSLLLGRGDPPASSTPSLIKEVERKKT